MISGNLGFKQLGVYVSLPFAEWKWSSLEKRKKKKENPKNEKLCLLVKNWVA
jgi:hypothetical protein